ncbi:hypothetical protein FHG87_021692 [Trinorchestia longiramus]|nr:hypothetical protein FHG87_021692 [Trinorchestia longiramus]
MGQKNDVVSLSCSRHGSRSLEALWAVSASKAKSAMCEHLADNANKMKASEWGAILYSKFNVRLFGKKDKSDWQELEQKKAKKRQMLFALKRDNEFNGPPSKKMKKNTTEEDVD